MHAFQINREHCTNGLGKILVLEEIDLFAVTKKIANIYRVGPGNVGILSHTLFYSLEFTITDF